jgi:hypothetical protein
VLDALVVTIKMDRSAREIVLSREPPLGFDVGDRVAVNQVGGLFIYAGRCP